MDYVLLGTLVKQLRIYKGMTQNELAEGIMTRGNLTKLESGKQGTTKEKIDLLFYRLGYTSKRFFSYILDDKDFKCFEIRKQLTDSLVCRNMNEAVRLIAEVETNEDFSEGLSRQFLLKSKAAFNQIQNFSRTERYAYLLEAIKITIPDFEEKLVHTYPLGGEDIEIIGMIATVHEENGEYARAIKLLRKLAKNISEHFMDEYEKARNLTYTLFNLSGIFSTQKRYQEALEVCIDLH